MGTKRPSCTLFDTLSNINTSDRKLQPGGKISRDPSPRPAMTAQSERERESNREDECRREREMEKTRDKARYKDVDPRERHYERDRGPVPRPREGEREWRQEEGRGRNGRLLSNVDKETEREVERGIKKGDTFPRMGHGSDDRTRKMTSATEMDDGRGQRRQRDKLRGTDRDDWERERERAWQREKHRERERDDLRMRAKEEGKNLMTDDKSQRRERHQELEAGFRDKRREKYEMGYPRDRREVDAGRKREKTRPNMGGREMRMPSPHKRRDREVHLDRREREKPHRRVGGRDTRSEGDSDERELRRQGVRDGERGELIYQHSRSEGDSKGKTWRETDCDRQGYREEDRKRHREREADRSRRGSGDRRRGGDRERERYREVEKRAAREPEREGERWSESGRDLKDDRGWSSERKENECYRESDQRKRRERETDPRREDTTGRGSRFLNESAPRVPPRAQSSGEWSSDMDSEMRYRGGRDSYEESGKESTAESEREDQRSPAERRHGEHKRSEKAEKGRRAMTGSVPEQRRMWLEPQRGKNSKESSLEDEFVDSDRYTKWKEGRGEKDRAVESQAGWRVKEESDERYQSSRRGRHYENKTRDERVKHREQKGGKERVTEGVSVDGEEEGDVCRGFDRGEKEHLSGRDGGIDGSRQRDAERESMTDNTEESDREEEGGSDYCARSESEGGSDTGWRQERRSMLSGEDGFVTMSSGGDDEDEREEDEEEFVDCQDFWEGGNAYHDPSTVGFKGRAGDKENDEDWTNGKEKTADEEGDGREKQQTYVFCVIGQTLPRSKTGKTSPSRIDQMGKVEKDQLNLGLHGSDHVAQQPQDDPHLKLRRNDDHLTESNQDTEVESESDRYNLLSEARSATKEPSELDIGHRLSSDTETKEGARKEEQKLPYAETELIKRDSQTEKLLTEWREKTKELAVSDQHSPLPSNPYADVCSQVTIEQILPNLDGIDIGAMSPEEKEAIRIRLSGAWSTSEEPKRHSQAPHLKWAKNVVREILGHSEEQTVDESCSEEQGDQGISQPEAAMKNEKQEREVAQAKGVMPLHKLTADDQHSELEEQQQQQQQQQQEEAEEEEEEDEEEELLEVEGLRGMRHADQYTVTHADTSTYTHADTLLDTERRDDHSPATGKTTDTSGHLHLQRADVEVNITEETAGEVAMSEAENEVRRENDVEIYLSVSNTLYKPNSCPLLHYETESDLLTTFKEGHEEEEGICEKGRESMGEEPEEVSLGEGTEVDSRNGAGLEEGKTGHSLSSSCSFRDLGPEARLRRRGIRKTTERRNEERVVVEAEEGVGRDRRARIFSTTDDEDDRSKSWGEVELRNVLDTIGRRKRNSKFFNAAQLYQQYSEAAQNFEILRQSRSEVLSVCEDTTPSPAPSPPPARRPLPPLPPVPHPHSLSHTGSITSVKSLPVPEPPKSEGRLSSPRLSISLTQSATLWRDLPGVRSSTELGELSEDEGRLQEVRFEVVTSEASYCRSLDIVVEHFVKSKQLGALLTTQDQNWLFSRLADVRAISHSFLSKLEERVESDIMHFTVCDIIARHCQRFKMVYVPYLTNQSYQDATYQRLMNENPGFKRIVEKLERSPVCQRLPLRSFLVLPFQRITRIKLLVQNIVKRTTAGTAEATQAIKALKLLEKLIQESNESISQMKSIESLVSLSAKVDFECRTLPLISQSRRLVREGPVTELMDFSLKDTERNIYLHLFNDYLLVSQQKEGGRFTVIDHAPVSELRAENCRVKLHSLQKNLFRLHTSHKSLLLRTDSQSDKLRWISALSRPHPEIDFSSAQDFPQMQCIRAFVAQQPDELSLEKADIILVHQQSSDRWVEGTRLSDRHRGWVPEAHLETISNSRVRQRNLSDALKLTTATAAV